ncbi:MAG TPA: hypothetical protein VFU32_03980 [Ktedonobacterales bacterium]|nr:hypothetical protein [Ktedonobacterales bacterium]
MPFWVKDQSKNILAPENLDKIKDAAARGLIFGYHYRPHSGGGPNYWVFQTFDAFMELVAHSKPGDWYGVCSLSGLLEQKSAIAWSLCGETAEAGKLLFQPEELQSIRTYLEKGPGKFPEILTIYYLPNPPEGLQIEEMRIDIDDVDDYDYWLETVEYYSHPGAEIAVFPYEVIEDESAYLLVEAQYPNERGEVFV